MARPTKYSEELAQAICDAIATGVPFDIACQASGIDRSTLKRWKRSKAPFCTAIKKARASALAARIENIRKAGQGGEELERKVVTVTRKDGTVEETVTVKRSARQWQADAWWLERQFCEQFGLNRIELKEVKQRLSEIVRTLESKKLV